MTTVTSGIGKQGTSITITHGRSEIEDHPHSRNTLESLNFQQIWQHSTADNNLTLYGFQRFKTSHLVNLRCMEKEIAQLDREIYQTGLKCMASGEDDRLRDRLGLRFSKKDHDFHEKPDWISSEMMLRLRNLLKEYDEALASFNRIMSMETFSLLDDERQSQKRTDLHLQEIYNTRLVRVDLGPRSTQDPIQRGIHKALRAIRYHIISVQARPDEEEVSRTIKGVSYQNSVLIAEILSRFLVAIVAGAFMVLPLVIVSYQDTQKSRLITISICIIVFALLISTTLKTAGLTTLATAAAYAAVLAGYVSSSK